MIDLISSGCTFLDVCLKISIFFYYLVNFFNLIIPSEQKVSPSFNVKAFFLYSNRLIPNLLGPNEYDQLPLMMKNN